MKRFFVLVAALPLALLLAGIGLAENNVAENGVLIIQGVVKDASGNPVAEASVAPLLNGKPYNVTNESGHGKGHGTVESASNGLFSITLHASPNDIEHGNWALQVSKPSFKTTEAVPLNKRPEMSVDNQGVKSYVTFLEVTLARILGPGFWIALLVLIGIYVLIAFELVHRTLAAMLGAAVILVITHTVGHFNPQYQVLTFAQSIHAVDWNVIFLLMGMMIIVGVLKESGVFQWMAYKSFQITGGRIFLLAAVLCVVTAVLSAFLDNVTTMLLLTPVTIEICLILGISPFAFLMPEIMASNFGGTATLIGDPPNIMIGSYAGLTFNDFAMTLTPVVIVTMVAQILYTKWYYGRDYQKAKVADAGEMIGFLREKYRITDAKLLAIGGIVLLGVISLFILHGFFHMEVSVAAMFGASLILILSRVNVVKVIEHEIEWPSLVFFIMLFVIVGGAEETGILQYIADWIRELCKGNLTAAILLILWSSAILSAIVDNIPFTATMLPVVALLNKTIPGAESHVLWWALALGACYGGNATIIGASANVITTGIAEKAGHRITFFDFIKHGTPITIIGLAIASVFLLIAF